ncbi:histone-lysine N-methyltransferase SETD1A-like isoform X1 [Anneissia japonica]|uniref:histone-lysine N-methyltransferase SETD1A-like isoform X1 n=1 Tax=Anneissia japonica TaxID=1529436 RepID=UPI0014258BA7|nr:histone-lysine N-methyltransferase SETD1A-like isoform X1 [Anneissia japonica]
MSCVEGLRARADDGSPKLPILHDTQQGLQPDSKPGSRPSSTASSHSRASTCSRDSSIFEEEDVDSRYRTMQIPLPAIPLPTIPSGEWEEDMRAKSPSRDPPAIPSRPGIPADLPDRFPPPPPRPNRPTPAPRSKLKPTD